MRPPYLRVVPKPIATCTPANYPRPRVNGVTLRRNGRHWFLEQVSNGRVFEMRLTDWELRELEQQAKELLERNASDDDER